MQNNRWIFYRPRHAFAAVPAPKQLSFRCLPCWWHWQNFRLASAKNHFYQIFFNRERGTIDHFALSTVPVGFIYFAFTFLVYTFGAFWVALYFPIKTKIKGPRDPATDPYKPTHNLLTKTKRMPKVIIQIKYTLIALSQIVIFHLVKIRHFCNHLKTIAPQFIS